MCNEIAAYANGGAGGTRLVQDYTFGTANVTAETATTPGSTAVSFSFDYDQVQDITPSYNTNGSPGTPTTNGWNFTTGTADTSLAHNAPSSQPPCYCPGTLIATAQGEVPVERLAIGDRIMTVSGALRPIKWIGMRSYRGRFIMGRRDVLPICFKAGSLGAGLPRRDLWISPHHAMYFGHEGCGVLIEARDLVNGVSVVQAEHADLVEGAPSESFVDDDSRGMFHNAHQYARLYPEQAAGPARYCAPRLDVGYEVEAVRRRIAERAGLAPCRPHAGALRGHVDLVAADTVQGWAQNLDRPETPVCLDIYADGRLIGQTLANIYREDLEAAGLGSGRHSFAFTVPDGTVFPAEVVEVRRSIDGAALPQPRVSAATARAA